MPTGSSAPFSVRISAISSSVREYASHRFFRVPIPCSAETVPPHSRTSSYTTRSIVSLGCGRSARHGGHDVQVAVADMAVEEGDEAGEGGFELAAAGVDVGAHGAGRQADVEADMVGAERGLAELAGGIAQGPEALHLGQRLGEGGIRDDALLQHPLQPALEAGIVGGLVGALGLDQGVDRVLVADRAGGRGPRW